MTATDMYTQNTQNKYTAHYLKKKKSAVWIWRDESAVSSAGCLSKGLRFTSQNTQGGFSESSVTSVPGDTLFRPLQALHPLGAQTQRQTKHSRT